MAIGEPRGCGSIRIAAARRLRGSDLEPLRCDETADDRSVDDLLESAALHPSAQVDQCARWRSGMYAVDDGDVTRARSIVVHRRLYRDRGRREREFTTIGLRQQLVEPRRAPARHTTPPVANVSAIRRCRPSTGLAIAAR
jgi:hypothetical protein